jgi:predicted RNA binding protein YcfA (HicA-like mRNA interferase family)
MSKQAKTLAKLGSSPPPADLKWSDVRAALEFLGYRMIKNSGSRRKFVHPETKALIICHKPHPSPNVDKGCVADVAEHLRAHGLIR